MPTYDYLCKKCGKKFSEVHSMAQHARKRVKCPKCSSAQTEQVVQAFFAVTSRKS